MMSLVITVHVIACVLLITIVLVQRGRGGGFVENLSGLESVFGTKTSAFLTKATTVSAVVFFITCLLLAVMSVHKSKSLLEGYRPAQRTSVPAAVPVKEAPAAEKQAVEQNVPVTEDATDVQAQQTSAVTPVEKAPVIPQPKQGEVK